MIYYSTIVKCDVCGYTTYYPPIERREECPSVYQIIRQHIEKGWKFSFKQCMCPDCVKGERKWPEK